MRGRRMGGDENVPELKSFISAFKQALAGLGWTEGATCGWTGGDDINRSRALAQELVGLQPDIIVTFGTAPTASRRCAGERRCRAER